MILSTVTSCNKDDETQPSDLIIGEWTVESVSINLYFDDQSLVQYLMDQFQISFAEAELLENMFLEDYLESFTGTINIKKDNTYMINFGDEIDSGTWKMSSDGKSITFDEGTIDETVATIIDLSANALQIEMTQHAESDIDADGTEEDLDMEITMNLSK
jgi:hypothetical protein